MAGSEPAVRTETPAVVNLPLQRLSPTPDPADAVLILLCIALSLLLAGAWLRIRRLHDEIRRLQRAVNDAQSLSGHLFDALREPTCIVDPDGRLASVNPAFSALIGHSERTLVGRRAEDVLPSELAAALRRARDTQQDTDGRTVTLRGRRCRVHRAPLFDSSGHPVGTLARLEPETGEANGDKRTDAPEHAAGDELAEALRLSLRIAGSATAEPLSRTARDCEDRSTPR